MKKNIKILGLLFLLIISSGIVFSIDLPQGYDTHGELKSYIGSFIGTPSELGDNLNYSCVNRYPQRKTEYWIVQNKTSGEEIWSYWKYKIGGTWDPKDYIVTQRFQEVISDKAGLKLAKYSLPIPEYGCYGVRTTNVITNIWDGNFNYILFKNGSLIAPITTTSTSSWSLWDYIIKVNWTDKKVIGLGSNNAQYFGAWYTAYPLPTLPPAEPICGDRIVNQDNEKCDDGNLNNGDGCDNLCQWEVLAPICTCQTNYHLEESGCVHN